MERIVLFALLLGCTVVESIVLFALLLGCTVGGLNNVLFAICISGVIINLFFWSSTTSSEQLMFFYFSLFLRFLPTLLFHFFSTLFFQLFGIESTLQIEGLALQLRTISSILGLVNYMICSSSWLFFILFLLGVLLGATWGTIISSLSLST